MPRDTHPEMRHPSPLFIAHRKSIFYSLTDWFIERNAAVRPLDLRKMGSRGRLSLLITATNPLISATAHAWA